MAALGASIAGCASSGKFASVAEFCAALPPQKFEVKGATPFDQPWIDDTSEAVQAGCPDRKRPEPRPAEWDKPLAKDKAAPKKSLAKRLREKVTF